MYRERYYSLIPKIATFQPTLTHIPFIYGAMIKHPREVHRGIGESAGIWVYSYHTAKSTILAGKNQNILFFKDSLIS